MKKAKNVRRITNLFAIIALLVGVVPFAAAANFTTVFADGEETGAPVDSQPESDPVVEETGAQDEPATDEVLVEETAVEALPEEETELLEDAAPSEEAAPGEEDLSEIVEALNAADATVRDESGEALPLACNETADVLSSTDPFFWDGAQWIGYTVTGTGCPDNVVCLPSATPFQQAVSEAGAGNSVYVASGNYDEDVIVNDAGMSLIAFHSITVPDAALPNATVDSSGYAVVKSITLNADLLLNDGVYADLVVVNEPGQTGGRLDDAMVLVNDGGRIEADVVIYGADGHYRVKDKNHPEVNFEWECGEPNEVIYPGRTYRMTLMNPLDQTIIDYYTAHGDERNISPWNLDLSALERMEDLQIAVNVSEDFGNWSHSNEERIYWYLVGNTGSSNNIANINLNSTQQTMADEITNGDWDDVTRYWGIWFLYPTLENGKTDVSVNDRQLTFLVYDPRPVFGCTDPIALNYDPNADTDDETCQYYEGCMDPNALNYDPEAIVDDQSCRYPNETEEPPQFLPNPLPIPVTGEEGFIIPVTGVDGSEISGTQTIEITAAMVSILFIGIRFILFNKKKEIV